MTRPTYVDDVSQLPTTYVSVDLEGTGTFGPKNGIVELAVIPVQEGKIGTPKIWLFKPKYKITPQGTKVHGITNQDIQNCSPIEDHAEEIHLLLEDKPYVGHHVGLDVSLLRTALGRWEPVQVFDTHRITKRSYPDLPTGYKLRQLCDIFNLDVKINEEASRLFKQYPRQLSGFHTAGHDALACVYLIEHIRSNRESNTPMSQEKKTDRNKQLKLF